MKKFNIAHVLFYLIVNSFICKFTSNYKLGNVISYLIDDGFFFQNNLYIFARVYFGYQYKYVASPPIILDYKPHFQYHSIILNVSKHFKS